MTQKPEVPISLPPKPMSYGESQAMLAAMPQLFETIKRQNTAMFKAIKEQNELIEHQLISNKATAEMSSLVHDRIDALAVETRVTNYLLAELVAVHKSMVVGSVSNEREAIRTVAYHSILNGE